jgi:hypothetical protein
VSLTTDNGQEIKHSSKASVVIKLVDSNDNPVRFVQSLYEVKINENSLAGTVLQRFEVEDKESE